MIELSAPFFNPYAIDDGKTPEQRRAEAVRADAVRTGKLVETRTKDRTGREISEFVGSKSAWMDQFKSPAYRMIKIDKHAKGPF